ncbi:MAG TPA: hypothetical protein VIF60_05035 [Burkholderiaceae bacterium]
MRAAAYFLVVSLCSAYANAEEAASDDATLTALFNSDQAERTAVPRNPWPVIEKHDRERALSTLKLLKEGRLRSATDYCHASLIFHHGQELDQTKMAYSLAWIGYQLDPTNQECALLTAQAWDRVMTRQGKLQWYGTQYARRDEKAALSALLPVDKDAVTNAERRRFGVDPIP